MTFIGPSQREQTITSTAKTRFNKAAQSRRYADRGGDGFGDGDGDGDSVENATCVNGAGAGAVDGHGVGGARTGAGTTFVRRRLVGANTPWNLVRFAYVGGIRGHELVEQLDAGQHPLPAARRHLGVSCRTRSARRAARSRATTTRRRGAKDARPPQPSMVAGHHPRGGMQREALDWACCDTETATPP